MNDDVESGSQSGPLPLKPDPSISIVHPEPKSRFKAPGILGAVSAALVLIGIGLCSVGGLRLEGDSVHPVVVGIGTVSFWGGILGCLIGVTWLLAALIMSAGSKGKS